MRPLKLYLETSVWNFVFAGDAPYKQAATQAFFDNLSESDFDIFISNAVFEEIEAASPEKLREFLALIERHSPVRLEQDHAVTELAEAYLSHGALPRKANLDAIHVAFAAAYELDFVVSWNLRHIANIRRQEKVQSINLLNGYHKTLQMITPLEVSNYEK